MWPHPNVTYSLVCLTDLVSVLETHFETVNDIPPFEMYSSEQIKRLYPIHQQSGVSLFPSDNSAGGRGVSGCGKENCGVHGGMWKGEEGLITLCLVEENEL